MIVIGNRSTSGVVDTLRPDERRTLHLVRLFSRQGFRRTIAGLQEDRSPDAAARACPTVRRTANLLRARGRTVVTHGRVTSRGTDAVAGFADELGAERVLLAGEPSVDPDRLAEAAPCSVTRVGGGPQTSPEWFLTD